MQNSANKKISDAITTIKMKFLLLLTAVCLCEFLGVMTDRCQRRVCNYELSYNYLYFGRRIRIEPTYCTHVNVQRAQVSDRQEIHLDLAKFEEELLKVVDLKKRQSTLKIIISIQKDNFAQFTKMYTTDSLKKNFIRNLISFVRGKNIDGLNVDVQPAEGGNKEQFTLLFKDLKAAFEEESSRTKRPKLLLSVGIPSDKTFLDKYYDVAAISNYVDMLNLATYSFVVQKSCAKNPQHHSPLYSPDPSSTKTILTPHKLSVMALVYEYHQLCSQQEKMDDSIDHSQILSDRDKRDFMILLLDLLQSPDVDLKSLRAQIDHIIKPAILEAVFDLLRSIAIDGIKPLNDFFDNVSTLLSSNEKDGMIKRESVMGVYIRRMELAYNEMSFSQVVDMYNRVKRYYEAGFPESKEEVERSSWRKSSLVGISESALSMSLLEERPVSEPSSGNFSKKQAEYFIANQALMLSHHEGKALAPNELQQRLSCILSDNPDLAEAHFLSYINSLRVKEYCTAIHSLYHYFDRKASMPVDTSQNKKRGVLDEVAMRYAALNLASLQFRFGNKEECRAALREAIRMAQESNDQICLQHALVWLNLLGENHTGVTQLERSIKKTIDLSLPKLAVLGLHWISKGLGTGTEIPARVIDYFTQSNLINCMHSNYGMMCAGFVQRAAMWHYYGKR
ncbi:Anaphase-promoting complex subunit 5 [Bulinus truncatus]|nr:Anaphase-promoting complex subunit 5 [Bulinus truncatus]